MKTPPPFFSLLKLATALLLGSLAMHTTDSDDVTFSLRDSLTFHDLLDAGRDFGHRYRLPPAAVFHPKSPSDVAAAVGHIFRMGRRSELTVAARGRGHSLHGQAQAPGGIVIQMGSLKSTLTRVHAGAGKVPYADGDAQAWACSSLLDRLPTPHRRGTLSNAGVSGQAFRHGPQISNVRQLEVVTGRGELLNCSEKENPDLFHAALGGLGQFGIITAPRSSSSPRRKWEDEFFVQVRWIRVLYEDFAAFTEDQEMLISAEKTFDYVEGFVMVNRTGILNNWRSSFYPQDPLRAAQFDYDGKTLFCLEMAKNFNPTAAQLAHQEVEELLSRLRHVRSTVFQTEVTYVAFLDRVHASAEKLRSKGLWEVPHPWLNLFVPASRIWDNRTSAVIPDEEIFYLVGFLHSAPPVDGGAGNLRRALAQNERILSFCRSAGIKWMTHFGLRWETVVRRKMAYDPMAILAPGQRIFQKGCLCRNTYTPSSTYIARMHITCVHVLCAYVYTHIYAQACMCGWVDHGTNCKWS
ncbi:unnamed protein product [Spirodela intermedia]|uniref:cytokinin dehydrogenase n=1 Tax=Spirodela intermedia TaxID=51605 RepID=A0A7I8J0K2_SPIIN|nr:unnamed protein product [Spirodela intermedia]CAA6663579.1 unnamed protein product [Spirodela intermedia]